jgi:uncharacterized protein
LDKVTLVLGASTNPERFAYKAIISLQKRNIPVVAIGTRESDLGNLKIRKGKPTDIGPVHTITLYLNSRHQKEYYEYILSLNPRRIIFNPGTINPELSSLARNNGIEIVEDCMLIMLRNGRF